MLSKERKSKRTELSQNMVHNTEIHLIKLMGCGKQIMMLNFLKKKKKKLLCGQMVKQEGTTQFTEENFIRNKCERLKQD